MTIHIIQVSGQDAYDLIYPDHLAMLSTNNQETMRRTMINSTIVWLGYDDDKILCVWGLIAPSLLSDQAYLWLFTTEHLKAHVFAFVRHSQVVIEDMLSRYSTIVGHTLATAEKSIRWLKWLGAEFSPSDNELIPFEIRTKSWAQQHSAL